MTYRQWMEAVEKIRMQYFEGCITTKEYFNAAIARAIEVEQTETDDEVEEKE